MFPGSTPATRKDSHSYAKPLHPGLTELPAQWHWRRRGRAHFEPVLPASALKINFSLSGKDTPPPNPSQRLSVKTRSVIQMNEAIFVSADAEAVTTKMFRKPVKGNSLAVA